MKHLPQDIQDRLKQNKETGKFTGEYLHYDEQGNLKAVHCMMCDEPVSGISALMDAQGKLITARAADGSEIAVGTMHRYHNWAWRKLLLKMKHPDGRTFTCHPIVCTDCIKVMGSHLGDDLWACVMAGWHKEQENEGWSEEKSKAYFKMFEGCTPVSVEPT